MPENTNDDIERMYLEYREKLRRMAECIIHDYSDSYDVVADTFLHMVMHADWLQKLTEPMKAKYIYASCERICARYVSENRMVYLVELEEDDKPDELAQNMLDTVIERETLRKCLGELHPDYRRVFRLHYIDKMGYDEIAALENVSRESVIKSVSRVRQRLRAIMKNKFI